MDDHRAVAVRPRNVALEPENETTQQTKPQLESFALERSMVV
ncbi:hypothetical protein BASA60_000792, partial [Batrachochytrium salamandrivorans]